MDLLKDQKKAYWLFRQHYYKNEIGDENKNKLKERMIEGKKLADNYQKLAAEIQTVKKQIEKKKENKENKENKTFIKKKTIRKKEKDN